HVAWSPDGRHSYTASTSASLSIWEAATGKSIGPTSSEQVLAPLLAVSPDGQYYLARSADNHHRLHTIGDDSGLRTAHGGSAPTAGTFSSDSRYYWTGHKDGT